MKKRLLAWLLTAAMMIGLVPAATVRAAAAELSDVYTLSDDYISVSVSKKNGGFTIRTVEGDRLKKSDNDKELLYHDGQYDTSFLSFRVGEGQDAKDYIFGGKYDGSSSVAVTESGGVVQAVWSVDGLTFTQSISLTNTSSNESGMVSLNLSVTNQAGAALPVKARILYDTALGAQDFGYYQYTDSTSQKVVTVRQEKVLTGGIPDQLFAADDPYSPSIAAYTVTSGSVKPYRAAFGHWSHLASTLFDFEAVDTLDFTNARSEYMTADSACALYFDLGSVGAGERSALSTFYGVFSNHATPAGDSVAVNLTAPIRLTLNGDKTDFLQEAGARGSAHFAVTVDFANIAGENAMDLTDIVLAVRSSGNLRSLTDGGAPAEGQDYDTTAPFTIPYSELKVGQSKTKTLYFQAKPGSDAAYERITIGVYKPDENGQLSETYKLGEHIAYILLPGTDNDVPKVNFAAMTPKIIYTEGTRHLFVTVANDALLTARGNWDLFACAEDGRITVPVPHENITFKEGVMDVALTDDIRLSEGGWHLQLEWTDAAVSAGIVTADKKRQTAPELHFTVSPDRKYKNDAYGIIAVVETISDTGMSKYDIKSFGDAEAFEAFRRDTQNYEEILLVFKGEFTKKLVNNRAHYIAASTKTRGADGKPSVDNPIVINDCMDFEGGSVEVYYDEKGAICTEFDGDIYTNTERTSIWTGKAVFTKIEQGKKYSLVPYNENGVRANYVEKNGQTMLTLDKTKPVEYNTISLIWPFADGIGQTLSGMIFKLAYGQMGVMYQTGKAETGQIYPIQKTLGGVLSFTAALEKTFARGKVDENKLEPPTYWSELREVWFGYTPDKTGSLYKHIYRGGRYEDAWGHLTNLNEYDSLNNDKSVTASVMVRDVLFGCGQGFVGVNFNVGLAIKNYIPSLPDIEGTIAVNTVNDWSFGIDGKIELATFTVEAKVSFASKDDIPVPDELYVFVSGFEPGLNIDGLGVVWITGGGGGVKNLYDTIFMTQSVPPLKLLLSVSFDLFKVLSCQKATLSLGMTGIGLQAEQITVAGQEGLTVLNKMGLSLEWYPGIDARASINMDFFGGLIRGGGYMVLLSPDYDYVFFEMFARATVNVPASIPFVGGMQLGGVDLGVNNEKIWGAMEALKVKLGVTYYWGDDSVDFGSGTKTEPTFPQLLGYDDIPVYYDAETDQTLYMRVGTNTALMAGNLPKDGRAELMASGAWLKSDGDKRLHQFNLGARTGGDAAIVQILFDAASLADAEAKASRITVKDAGGADYGLVRYTGDPAAANANLTYDPDSGKATYAFTATEAGQYGKTWTLTTPENSRVLLYNVAGLPKVDTVAGSLRGNEADLSWTGSSLAELDQINFFLCPGNDPENGDPGYFIDLVDIPSDLEAGSNAGWRIIVPAYVPSGDYYIRAVYTKADEVNGVVFSTDKVHWENQDTPGTAAFRAAPAGNLQYALTIDPDDQTDGYLVTIYNSDGKVTDFAQVNYAAAESGHTEIHVGGRYTAMDGNGAEKAFGLTGGQDYIIGVTPYQEVETNYGTEEDPYIEKGVVYGTEVRSGAIRLPEMVTPTVAFSVDKTAQSRTETTNGQTYQKPVYTANGLTVTAKVSEPVTGTWRLDGSDESIPFTGAAEVSIPLTGLTEGGHTLTLAGAAADGDSFAATYTFTVDTLPPQLLLSSPVGGSFFGKDGRLTVTGVTDAGARLTIAGTDCVGKTIEELDPDFDPSTGAFSFQAAISDPNSASQHRLTISVADDVGNATAPKTVEVSHGGLGDLASLEVMVDGRPCGTGSISIPDDGLRTELTLVGVTSDNTRFLLTGHNVSWELTTVEGSASISGGALTAAAGSQGIITGKLAVAEGAYRTASLCFGAKADPTVTVTTTEGGSVTGGGSYKAGDTVTLTATPDSGYRFAGWTVLGATVSDTTNETITFTMPEGNVTAHAVFKRITGTVAVTTTEGGSTTGSGVYNAGDTVTLTATPDSGYRFTEWDITGVTVSDATKTTISFMMPEGDVTAKAKFERITGTVTVTTTEGGSTTGSGVYNAGDTVTLTATPESGYRFTEWDITGVTVSDKTNTTISFTMPEGDVTAKANFEHITGTVTVTTTEGGTATGNGVYNAGDTVTLTATPESGYRFVNWTVDGVTVSDTTKTTISFMMPEGDVTAKANFEHITGTVTVTTTEGGSATGNGVYNAGDTVTLTATPESGYSFVHWVLTGVTVSDTTNATISFTMPEGDVTATAIFDLIPRTVTVSATPGGSASGGGSYKAGDTVTLTATPESGYRFKEWDITGVTVSDKTKTTISFMMPEGDVTAIAKFEHITGNVTVTATTGGSASGGGSYKAGDTVTLAATPDSGYRFTEWDITGVTVSDTTKTTISFTMPEGDVTATASFEHITGNVTVTTTEGGSATGNGVYNAGETVTLTATPESGYSFVRWVLTGVTVSDATNPTISFTMPEGGDVTATAIFDRIPRTVTVTATTGGSASGGGSYNAGDTVTLTATPESGYSFVRWVLTGVTVSDATNATISFTMPEGDVTATAIFDLIPRTVAVSATPGGSASGGGSYKAGDPVTLTATPESGYRFAGWTVLGATVSDTTNETITFTMPEGDVTAKANFEHITGNVTVTATEGGTATGSGVYNAGETVTLTATPESGYRFKEWTVDGVTVRDTTKATISFTMPEGDVTAKANFEHITGNVTVTATEGGSATGSGVYNAGETVTLTATPESGYRFKEWTVDGVTVSDTTKTTISFMMPEGDVTATANFERISDAGGADDTGAGNTDTGSRKVSAQAGEIVRIKLPAGESRRTYVPCYVNSSGTVTYVPISAVVDGYVTFLAPENGTYQFEANPADFRDVAGHWAEDSIAFCAARGIFQGVGDGRFAPEEPMSRAMFATVLYRLAGAPEVDDADGFSDIADGSWYTDAVLWGQQTGIIGGYGDGRFGPDDPVTREQMCAMIVRWLDCMGYTLPTVQEAGTFTDADRFSAWAREPIAYAQAGGLIHGLPDGTFDPGNHATRAENSAVFQRMILAILTGAKSE